MIKKVIYNWYILETSDIMTLNNDNYDTWNEIENNFFVKPNSDWEVSVTNYKRRKTLKIEWKLKADTLYELNNTITNFKKSLLNWFKKLDVYVETSNWVISRRITKAIVLNWQDLIKRWGQDITFCSFSIEFYIPSWYYEENTEKVLTNNGLTWDSIITDIYNWTTYTSLNITLTINDVGNWISYIEVVSWNLKLRVDRNFVNWDILNIDWINQWVKVNWNVVDYSWFFLQYNWENIMINVGTGWVDYDSLITYYNRYI